MSDAVVQSLVRDAVLTAVAALDWQVAVWPRACARAGVEPGGRGRRGRSRDARPGRRCDGLRCSTAAWWRGAVCGVIRGRSTR